MLNLMKKISLTAVLMILIGTVAVTAQDYQRDGDDSYYYERSNIDRYLDVEVWTDHSDAEYIEGDNIVIYFRSNRDAFVSIYSIDTRGMVNLMYPSDPAQDNFVRGGVTYSLPGPDDDFDLEINGPDGIENIQIIASRERFTIPDWYNNSGLVCTDDDRHDYMDYLNERYFVRYDGQRFAYDRAVIFVEEWEPTYFRPVYYPDYPNWAIVGNVYVDYAWGSSVYINGYYWGVTPLYVPRLLVGWHTMTIYDHYGYCWESDFHCSRYNTVVFDRTSIRPRSEIVSKFKEVRAVGYRNPVSHGYPKYKESIIVKKAIRSGLATTPAGVTKDVKVKVKSLTTTEFKTSTKKHIRGSSKVVKTERGYQSTALGKSKKSGSSRYSGSKSSSKKSSSSGTSRYGKSSTSSKKSREKNWKRPPKTCVISLCPWSKMFWKRRT